MDLKKLLPYRIAIAPKNSPWGVIKHPTRGNVYRHILRFDSEVLKDNYINYQLFGEVHGDITLHGDYKTDLGDGKKNMFFVDYIDEMSFRFKVEPGSDNYRNMDELMNRDFCVVRKPEDPRYYFYTLQVKNAEQGYIEFLAELDVFFTYNLDDNLLSTTRKSFVRQGHENRYLPTGHIN
jgi:hypothetical protein